MTNKFWPKYLVAFLLLTSVSFSDATGQQLSRRTQFIFNTYLVNPAVAGTMNYVPVMASYRNQWTGFDHAPVTYTLSSHAQIPNTRVGIGGVFFSDQLGGAYSRTGAEITGAYRVDLNNQDAVSFGLSGIMTQFKFDSSDLLVFDKNDESITGLVESKVNFDANFGLMVYGPNYFFGFSIPQLIQTRIDFATSTANNQNKTARHFQFMGSYKYYITDELDIQPAAMAKFTASTPVQFDVYMKLTYLDFLWGGVTYRHKDAVAFSLGAEYQGFAFGYSYDVTVTDARAFSPHTHELTLGYYIFRRGFVEKSLLGPRIIRRSRVVG
jgi:type IX secretion system PorP/SprF family membrane protein